MTKDEPLNLYKKIITINSDEPKVVMKCVNMLFSAVYEDASKKGEWLYFFRLNYTHSERGVGAKDLVLEWASIPEKANHKVLDTKD